MPYLIFALVSTVVGYVITRQEFKDKFTDKSKKK